MYSSRLSTFSCNRAIYSLLNLSKATFDTPLLGLSSGTSDDLGSSRGADDPGIGSPDSGSSASVLMAGRRRRSSSNPALRESRRFCSAALCDVRRFSPSGGMSAAAAAAPLVARCQHYPFAIGRNALIHTVTVTRRVTHPLGRQHPPALPPKPSCPPERF